MASQESLACFKAYDIRGKVPQELNNDLAYKIGRAMVEFLNAQDSDIVVGRDIRESGKDLSQSLIKGITDAGANAINIGLCGTEMVYYATAQLSADGGVMITASHNPPEYNGMKLVRDGARPISSETGLKDIERLVLNDQFIDSDKKGAEQGEDVASLYVQQILKTIDIESLKSYKVVVNSGNGCAGPILDRLEKFLPFHLIKVHHDPDPAFPNGVPNPMIIENRTATAEIVKSKNADIGIAWDGDFDRCFFFDENGNFIEGYYIVGFLAESMLEKNPGGKIIYDPRLTWNTVEIVEQNGGVPLMSKSGHAFIKELMRKEDAVYGGEMSAHHYFRDFFYCDSGMLPWLLVLEIMSKRGKKFSELVEERIAKFPVSGEINLHITDQDAAIERANRHFAPENPQINTIDGLSFEFPNWRFNVRKSNTEPILRVNVETRGDRELLERKTQEVLDVIQAK